MRINQKTYDINSTDLTWVCPAGVTKIIVYGQGGGGGGGQGASTSDGGRGGNGGNSTFLVPRVITVIPGTSYTIVVGAGGLGSYGYTSFGIGESGGNSFFGTTEWLGAIGGFSGGYIEYVSPAGTFATSGYITSSSGPISSSPTFTNYPRSLNGGKVGVPNSLIGNYGTFNYSPSLIGVTSLSGGGAPGSSSDAGLGGRGGNGVTTLAAENGDNANGIGAGGGGGGASHSTFTTAGNGGQGSAGRIIVTWIE